MKHKDPTDPHAWLWRAKANLTLAEKGGRLKGVAAVCLAYGLEFPKNHSLVHLIDVLEAGGVEIPESVREADILTPYAVQSRYPSVAEDITKDEYRDALKLASKVVFWADKAIK